MSKSREKTSEFINSRLGLTIVGFILTGIVGGFLTYFWHTKEYTYKAKLEQEYSRIKAHSEAWENLYNKIFDQTSEFIVAVGRVISMYEHTIVDPKHQREIIENFNSVSRQWQKESVVIKSQLGLLFFKKDTQEDIAEIENKWTELLNKSEGLHRHIANLVTKYPDVRKKSRELTQKKEECKKVSEEFTEEVHAFGKTLISSIFSQ